MKRKFLSLSLLVTMGGALSTMSVVSSCSDDKVNYLKKEEQGKEEQEEEEEEKKEVKYRVTFDSQGGTEVLSQEVKEGGFVEKPQDPTKDDSVFVGWFKEATCTTPWDFEKDKITQNLTLYAKWGTAAQWAIISNSDKDLFHWLGEVQDARDNATKIIFETDADLSSGGYAGGKEMDMGETGKIKAYYNSATQTLYVGTSEDFICLSGCLLFDIDNNGSYQSFFEGFEKVTVIENIGVLRTDSVTSMNGMFNGCSKLTSLDLSSFNTEKVESMTDMFKGCSKLTSLNLSSFDTKNVTKVLNMFSGCSLMNTLILSNKFDVRNAAPNIGGMFDNCGSTGQKCVVKGITESAIKEALQASTAGGMVSTGWDDTRMEFERK